MTVHPFPSGRAPRSSEAPAGMPGQLLGQSPRAKHQLSSLARGRRFGERLGQALAIALGVAGGIAGAVIVVAVVGLLVVAALPLLCVRGIQALIGRRGR